MLSLEQKLELSGRIKEDLEFLFRILMKKLAEIDSYKKGELTEARYLRYRHLAEETLEIAELLREVSYGTNRHEKACELYDDLRVKDREITEVYDREFGGLLGFS